MLFSVGKWQSWLPIFAFWRKSKNAENVLNTDSFGSVIDYLEEYIEQIIMEEFEEKEIYRLQGNKDSRP